uniref:Parvin, beta n=1 Tax=Mus musculus TaxID=10090 RepID=F2Z417_MOUSE
MSSAPPRSPTPRAPKMKKDESFLGKLGGTLARKKKTREEPLWTSGYVGTLPIRLITAGSTAGKRASPAPLRSDSPAAISALIPVLHSAFLYLY